MADVDAHVGGGKPPRRGRAGARPGEAHVRPWKHDRTILARVGEHWERSMRGESAEQIAAATDTPVSTVRRDLRRGRELLVDRMVASTEAHIERLHAVWRESWRSYQAALPGSAASAAHLRELRETEVVIAKLDGTWKPDPVLTQIAVDARDQRQQELRVQVSSSEPPTWLTPAFMGAVDQVLEDTSPGVLEPVAATPPPPALAPHRAQEPPAPAPVADEPADQDRASHPVVVTSPPAPGRPRVPIRRVGGGYGWDWDKE